MSIDDFLSRHQVIMIEIDPQDNDLRDECDKRGWHYLPTFTALDPGGIPAHMIAVPWIGQNVKEITSDDYSNNDCGPDCVAMVLHWRGLDLTVDEISKATGLPYGYSYTVPGQLIAAAKKFNLNLTRAVNLSIDSLKHEIDAGRPVITLVHYGSLHKRSSATFKAGHWIVVVGYTDTSIVYHDPLWQSADDGAFIELSYADFEKAMLDCRIDGNTANQGLVMS